MSTLWLTRYQRWRQSATHGAMGTLWSTLADTLAEVEAVGDTRCDAHALVDTG